MSQKRAHMTGAGIADSGTTRRDQIVRSIDDFRRRYQEYLGDNRSDEIEQDGPLGDAIEVMTGTVNGGFVPENCLELVLAARQLGVEWQRYNEGEWVQSTLAPTDRFHAACRAVEMAAIGIEKPVESRVESVASLRSSGVPDAQIAKIYGKREPGTGIWSGPFHQRGIVQVALIDQEARDPGSVIPADWRHPRDVADAARFELEQRNRIARIEQRATATAQKGKRKLLRPTEDAVVEFLRERAFLAQVVKRWDISAEEVQAIADRHNIVIETPDSTRERARIEAEATGDSEQQPAGTRTADPDPQRESDGTTSETVSDGDVSARIIDLFASGLSRREIAQAVTRETSQAISTQRVIAVLREHEKRVTAEAAANADDDPLAEANDGSDDESELDET